MVDFIQQLYEIVSSQWGSVVSVGVGGGALSALVSNFIQQKRANVFPVLYSGIERLPEDNDTAKYYAAVNDTSMAVTEAWNEARKGKGFSQFFHELSGPKLAKSCDDVTFFGKRLLGDLGEYVQLAQAAHESAERFGNSWKYNSHDNYRTEFYTTTESDGKGGTKIVTKTRQVYDSTDHYFNFDRKVAQSAGDSLAEILSSFDERDMFDPQMDGLVISPGIFIESEMGGGLFRGAGFVSSRGKTSEETYVRDTIIENEKHAVTAEELNKYLNMWLECARLKGVLPLALSSLKQLRNNREQSMGTILASDKNYHYKTSSTSHSGPAGYRASREIEDVCLNVSNEIFGLRDAVNKTMQDASVLLDISKGNLSGMSQKKAAHKALDLAVESYLCTFPESEIKMDQRVSHGWTAGIAAGMVVIAGAATYVFHPASGLF